MMWLSIPFSVGGLIIEIVGVYLVIKSFLFSTPKNLKEILDTLHGNKLRDPDIDRNKFLKFLIQQSIEAQSGLIVLVAGLIMQLLYIFFNISMPLVLFFPILLIILCMISYIDKKRLSKAREKLLN